MRNKPVFRPSFGNRPDELVGRDDVVSQIFSGLQSYPGSAERATFVMGQRGMGKTAILLELADRARDLGFVVARVTCGETMLDSIIDVLQRSGAEYVKEPRKPIKGFNAGALGFSVGLTFTEEARRSYGFRVKLQMICEKLAEFDKGVLLLVDEVDPSVEQMRTLATVYQELVGEEADIAIVMAGLPSAVSETLNYRTLTFLNRAQRIALGVVPVPEVEAYYHSAFARARIVADAPAIEKAAELTEGFPYLIQLVGYYLAQFSNEDEPVSDTLLDRVSKVAMAEFEVKIVKAMLNPLSKVDINFLEAMAQDDGATKTSDLETRLGLSHGTIQTYRKRLLDAGVITSPRRGEIEFVLPSLAGYLRAESD